MYLWESGGKPGDTLTNEDIMDKKTYTIAAKHETFGFEGVREYYGSELGAKFAARRIAKAAGFGWAPVVQEAE